MQTGIKRFSFASFHRNKIPDFYKNILSTWASILEYNSASSTVKTNPLTANATLRRHTWRRRITRFRLRPKWDWTWAILIVEEMLRFFRWASACSISIVFGNDLLQVYVCTIFGFWRRQSMYSILTTINFNHICIHARYVCVCQKH